MIAFNAKEEKISVVLLLTVLKAINFFFFLQILLFIVIGKGTIVYLSRTALL